MSARQPTLQASLGYRPLQEIVRARLREAILGGQYRPGDRLRILALGEEYGVSSMPVREALRTLEAEGLVEFEPNRGAVVRSLSPEDVKETFLMRISLEGAALREAIPNLTEGDLDHLQQLIDRMDQVERDPVAWTKLNQEFHLTMYQAAHFPRIHQILMGLAGLVRPYLGLYLARTSNLKTARAQHVSLLRACRRRDAAGAVRTLEEHVVHTRDLVIAALDEMDRARAPARTRARAVAR